MNGRFKAKYLIQIVVSVTILGALFYALDFGRMMANFSAFPVSLSVLLVVLLVPSLSVRVWRWKILYDQPKRTISYADSASLLLVGQALNLVLPASSGDVVKSYFGYRLTGVKERMLSICVIEKLIALGSVGLLGLSCSLVQGYYYLTGLSVVLIAACLGCLVAPPYLYKIKLFQVLLGRLTSISGKRINFLLLLEESSISGGKFGFAVVLSVLGWLFTYLQFYLCFYAMDNTVPFFYVLSLAPLLTVARLFPFTLSGYGSDEAVISFFFSKLGLTLEQILVAAIVYRFINTIVPGLIGWLVMGGLKTNARAARSHKSV